MAEDLSKALDGGCLISRIVLRLSPTHEPFECVYGTGNAVFEPQSILDIFLVFSSKS